MWLWWFLCALPESPPGPCLCQVQQVGEEDDSVRGVAVGAEAEQEEEGLVRPLAPVAVWWATAGPEVASGSEMPRYINPYGKSDIPQGVK